MKSLYRSDQIRSVHLEITTKCNVRCPQCSRNFRGDTNPALPQIELSLADIKQIFPPSFLQQINELHICGNYGDATAAQDTAEAMRYFRTTNRALTLQIMTHGSARSTEWWRDLAALEVVCHFGLDGLEDTNHIYRRDTNWQTIMRNVRAFIDAGGKAIWNFIVFRHNEHQVDAARKLSQDMGFMKFVVKKTGRFLLKSEQDIFARDGSVIGILQGPQNSEYQNEAMARMDQTHNLSTPGKGRVERLREYWDTTEIFCKAASHSRIFVSAEALVIPCCYLGAIHSPFPSRMSAQLLERMEDPADLCAFNYSIAEIVDGKFFQDTVPKGWEVGSGRLEMCAHMCGSQDYVGSQTEDRMRHSERERQSGDNNAARRLQ